MNDRPQVASSIVEGMCRTPSATSGAVLQPCPNLMHSDYTLVSSRTQALQEDAQVNSRLTLAVYPPNPQVRTPSTSSHHRTRTHVVWLASTGSRASAFFPPVRHRTALTDQKFGFRLVLYYANVQAGGGCRWERYLNFGQCALA